MSVNIKALVQRLGHSYDNLNKDGLIPYKTKPIGRGGDATLDMRKEYVYLAFEGDEEIIHKPLTEITVTLIPENMPAGWVFPNELPFGLEQVMTDTWLHQNFGTPIRQAAERYILTDFKVNRSEVFVLPDLIPKVVFSVQYDLVMKQHASKITFKSLADLEARWPTSFKFNK